MTKELDNLQDKVNWRWRNTMYPTRFFGFDARAAFPIPILIFYLRLSTLILLILSLIFFKVLENLGLTFPAAMRNFRMWIVGGERTGWLKIQNKKFLDFG